MPSRGQRALGLDLLSKHVPGVQGSEAAEARRHWGTLPGSSAFPLPTGILPVPGSRSCFPHQPTASFTIYSERLPTPNVKTMQGPSVTTETSGSQTTLSFKKHEPGSPKSLAKGLCQLEGW